MSDGRVYLGEEFHKRMERIANALEKIAARKDSTRLERAAQRIVDAFPAGQPIDRVLMAAHLVNDLEAALRTKGDVHPVQAGAFYADGVCVYAHTHVMGESSFAICTCGNHDDARRVAHALNLSEMRPEGTE